MDPESQQSTDEDVKTQNPSAGEASEAEAVNYPNETEDPESPDLPAG